MDVTPGIQIAEPCHENWDRMTSREQGRFCESCSKTVHDVAGWEKEKILSTYQANDKNLCIRIPEEQLEIQRHRSPSTGIGQKWIKWLALAYLLIGIKTTSLLAQNPNIAPADSNEREPIKLRKLSGSVLDSTDSNLPLASAEITIKNQQQLLARTITDSYGKFSIDLSGFAFDSLESVELECSYLGLKTMKKKIDISEGQEMDIYMKEEVVGMRTVTIERQTCIVPRDMMIGKMRTGKDLQLLRPYDTKTYSGEELQRYGFR
jgi:CarboxypepD_reg-like domain